MQNNRWCRLVSIIQHLVVLYCRWNWWEWSLGMNDECYNQNLFIYRLSKLISLQICISKWWYPMDLRKSFSNFIILVCNHFKKLVNKKSFYRKISLKNNFSKIPNKIIVNWNHIYFIRRLCMDLYGSNVCGSSLHDNLIIGQ